MNDHAAKRRGMTAIEVLAATMLASLMLAAVAGLTGALAREQRVLRSGIQLGQWHQQLADQLEWDLKNSRRFSVSRQGLLLEGYMGRSFVTGRPTGQPALVEYYLADTAAGRWLVRRERHLDAQTNDASRVELVCHGVERLVCGAAVVDQASVQVPPATAALGAIPDRLVVQLYAPAATAPLIDRMFDAR